MTRAYFVSDLHISSAKDPKARRFLSFLRELSAAKGVTHLFLLGDIFDMWLADHRYFVKRYEELIDELTRLHDEGVAIHYFEGNHDLHLEKYWARELGFAVHRGPLTIDLAGKRLRLEHGDQMDPDDRGYRFLRWFLRTPPLRFLIHNLPGKVAAWIGERASATSRAYTSQTKSIGAADAIAKIRAHADREFAKQPFDLLIAGHVHVRDDYRRGDERGSYRAVNLGTWLEAPGYFVVDGSGGKFCELRQPVAADVAQ